MTNGVIGKVTAGGGTHLVTVTFYGTCETAKGTAVRLVTGNITVPNTYTALFTGTAATLSHS